MSKHLGDLHEVPMKAGKVAASNNTARPLAKRNNKRQSVEGDQNIILIVRWLELALGGA